MGCTHFHIQRDVPEVMFQRPEATINTTSDFLEQVRAHVRAIRVEWYPIIGQETSGSGTLLMMYEVRGSFVQLLFEQTTLSDRCEVASIGVSCNVRDEDVAIAKSFHSQCFKRQATAFVPPTNDMFYSQL